MKAVTVGCLLFGSHLHPLALVITATSAFHHNYVNLFFKRTNVVKYQIKILIQSLLFCNLLREMFLLTRLPRCIWFELVKIFLFHSCYLGILTVNLHSIYFRFPIHSPVSTDKREGDTTTCQWVGYNSIICIFNSLVIF